MAKKNSDTVTITPLRPQVGAYGYARPHEPIEVEGRLAEKLLKNKKAWVSGVSDEAKARAKRSAETETQAKAAAKEKAAAEAEKEKRA